MVIVASAELSWVVGVVGRQDMGHRAGGAVLRARQLVAGFLQMKGSLPKGEQVKGRNRRCS